jgi:hypothetical protein
MAFSSMVQALLQKMQAKQGGQLAGIGKYGPQYNPGPTRTFEPGPMAAVPFMPQAQVGPQTINLGLGDGRNPNAVPGASMAPAGQTANYNQQPGTFAGPAAPNMRPFNAQAALAGLQLLQRTRSEPLPWIQMPVSRWGGQ